jgi:hypothetical protein
VNVDGADENDAAATAADVVATVRTTAEDRAALLGATVGSATTVTVAEAGDRESAAPLEPVGGGSGAAAASGGSDGRTPPEDPYRSAVAHMLRSAASRACSPQRPCTDVAASITDEDGG